MTEREMTFSAILETLWKTWGDTPYYKEMEGLVNAYLDNRIQVMPAEQGEIVYTGIYNNGMKCIYPVEVKGWWVEPISSDIGKSVLCKFDELWETEYEAIDGLGAKYADS